jgi:GNAT superfamily N-acetyltransferase
MIEVKQATLADLLTVSSILKEAAGWLQATGRPMWRDDELDPERIREDVADGLFNLGHYDGVPAGTIKFQLEDARFWPDVPENDAAYAHRIAVRRQFAGKGVSIGMLGWAVSHAAALGRSYLRLDCEADRQELRAIYKAIRDQLCCARHFRARARRTPNAKRQTPNAASPPLRVPRHVV